MDLELPETQQSNYDLYQDEVKRRKQLEASFKCSINQIFEAEDLIDTKYPLEEETKPINLLHVNSFVGNKRDCFRRELEDTDYSEEYINEIPSKQIK